MPQVVGKDVPAEKLSVTVEGLTHAGATEVSVKKQKDGKYTVTAQFAD